MGGGWGPHGTQASWCQPTWQPSKIWQRTCLLICLKCFEMFRNALIRGRSGCQGRRRTNAERGGDGGGTGRREDVQTPRRVRCIQQTVIACHVRHNLRNTTSAPLERLSDGQWGILEWSVKWGNTSVRYRTRHKGRGRAGVVHAYHHVREDISRPSHACSASDKDAHNP